MQPSLTEDIRLRLEGLKATGDLRTLAHTTPEGRYILKDGQRMLNLSSNDYLGLAADRACYADFLQGVSAQDLLPSSSSSRLLTGNHPVFDELETTLAHLYHAESALTFNSGYDANTGILPALAGKDDIILADKLVHASLIDGMRLGQAPWLRYRHNDLNHLEHLLRRHAPDHRRVFIVTESLFSMDGDEAPLRELVNLKRRYPDILLYVDEAHAFGLRGPQGLGCAEEADVVADIDLLVGTLGKAAASAGAFVVCKQAVRQYLVNRMRPFIFTTALPPIVAAWSLYVIRHLPDLADRRRHLADIAGRVHRALAQLTLPDLSCSHIIPIPVGASDKASRLAKDMQRKGFYLLPVRPPTVPEGTARLRLSLRADLTDEEVGRLLDVLADYHTSSTHITSFTS